MILCFFPLCACFCWFSSFSLWFSGVFSFFSFLSLRYRFAVLFLSSALLIRSVLLWPVLTRSSLLYSIFALYWLVFIFISYFLTLLCPVKFLFLFASVLSSHATTFFLLCAVLSLAPPVSEAMSMYEAEGRLKSGRLAGTCVCQTDRQMKTKRKKEWTDGWTHEQSILIGHYFLVNLYFPPGQPPTRM